MKLSISLKVILFVVILFIIIFLIISYTDINNYSNDMISSYIDKSVSVTNSLESGIADLSVLQNPELLNKNINKILWINSDIMEINFMHFKNGQLLTIASNNPVNVDKISDENSLLAYNNNKIYFKVGEDEHGKGVVIDSPLHISGQVVGTVQAHFTMEDIYNKINQNLISSVIRYSLFLILTIIILYIFLRKIIIKPIIKINNEIKDLPNNNYDYKLNIKSEDEIGDLSKSFDGMTNEVKKSRKNLENYAKELEDKVSKRTKELDERVNELTDTKTAVLNMMEDTDEMNRDLIKTRDELRKSLEELKKLDVKKNEFISIAAHELKTPMTSIQGFSQLLQNQAIAKDAEKRDKYLKIMDKETKRLTKLVTDILDLSRLDLGTVKLNLEEVDINNLMDTVQKEMNIQITEHGLQSEYSIQKNLPKIVTDSEKLMEIMLNLINNSVKYTPKGKIIVTVTSDKNNINFSVKDTGIGISKDNREKLFNRFYQIDSSYTRSSGGTGLGLALCKEFLKLLGGKIDFKSELGKGSEFYFSLPIKGRPTEYVRDEEKGAIDALKKADELSKKTGNKK